MFERDKPFNIVLSDYEQSYYTLRQLQDCVMIYEGLLLRIKRKIHGP